MARSLLAMVDRDLSGNVDFYEFKPLVHSLRRWVSVYETRCDPESGKLTGHAWSLGTALRDLGFQVPRRLQGLVVVRYGDHLGNISLQDFIMVSCRISVMLERYERQCDGGKAITSLHLNDWLQDTIYC
ncbi:hypothetical protein Pmani_035420 [Petrolisthes manimaculis]|uniref:EF-hand domain-containing protein n=1 Tax=Petrolisthes manimaculis TaxID=1843537 RepID=A0AAE1NKM1_9EUCA|nr:hypothetical protein Pmani_035420 [Petrolisthes manimaculis]